MRVATSSGLALGCVGSLVLAVVLAVIGLRALGRARGVRQMQTPRRQGRTSGAVTTLVLAGVALLAALGTGVGSVVVRFAQSLPS